MVRDDVMDHEEALRALHKQLRQLGPSTYEARAHLLAAADAALAASRCLAAEPTVRPAARPLPLRPVYVPVLKVAQ